MDPISAQLSFANAQIRLQQEARQQAAAAAAATSKGSGGSSFTSNLNNIPDIKKLTEKINAINQAAQQQANQARIPGAAGIEQQSSANIGNALDGQLPADVIAQIQQQAAERGVGMGSPGSDNASAAYLRALGLTSLDMTNTGQNWASAAYARNPSAPIYDAGNLIITPGEQAGIDLSQAQMNNQAALGFMNYLANKRAASYSGSGGGGGNGGYSYSPSPVTSTATTGATGSVLFGPTTTATGGTGSGSASYAPNPAAAVGGYNGVAAVGQSGYQPYSSGYNENWMYGG